jgi:hypothetical protein
LLPLYFERARNREYNVFESYLDRSQVIAKAKGEINFDFRILGTTAR